MVLRGATQVHPDHPLHGVEVVPGDAPYHRSTGEVQGAEWTGRDQRNRLVFAARGSLFARVGSKDVLLADFNDERPDPQPPPRRAMSPIR